MAVTTPQLPHHRRREEQQQWLVEGKYLVVFFGLLGYEILAVCDTEEEATEVCVLWKVAATLGGAPLFFAVQGLAPQGLDTLRFAA